jgi:hypothetical protein
MHPLSSLVRVYNNQQENLRPRQYLEHHNNNQRQYEHEQQYDFHRFLLLEQNRGPAVASTHSYSTYVGYHKRTGRPTDSYYAYPTDDADYIIATATSTTSATSTKQSSMVGSSNGTLNAKWPNNSPAVALSAQSAAAAAKEHLQYRLTREETDLIDVWFCLGLALTWTVWMLSSFVKSELLRYSQDSITVRGHVLQVTIEEETSLGTGIPTYKAVIDYMVATSGGGAGGDDAAASSKIQIRKQFETQTHLEQGFANVELLVLHDEPTHSVLKEDWEAQVEEMEDQDENICCLPNKWWKRIWITICLTVILASLPASVLAVHRLPHSQRSTGWICVCAGIALLLPTAVSIRMLMTAVQRSLQQGSEAAGVIVQGAVKNYSCDALDNILDVTSACDDDKNVGVVGATAVAGAAAASTTGNRQQIVQTPDVDETGCYVIRMPPRGQRFRSDVSDISAVSQTLAQLGMHHGNSGLLANGAAGGGAVIVGGEVSSSDGVVGGGGAVVGVSAFTARDPFS